MFTIDSIVAIASSPTGYIAIVGVVVLGALLSLKYIASSLKWIIAFVVIALILFGGLGMLFLKAFEEDTSSRANTYESFKSSIRAFLSL